MNTNWELPNLMRQYIERFGITTICLFQDDETLAEQIRESLRTGKPPVEPELPPGVVI